MTTLFEKAIDPLYPYTADDQEFLNRLSPDEIDFMNIAACEWWKREFGRTVVDQEIYEQHVADDFIHEYGIDPIDHQRAPTPESRALKDGVSFAQMVKNQLHYRERYGGLDNVHAIY